MCTIYAGDLFRWSPPFGSEIHSRKSENGITAVKTAVVIVRIHSSIVAYLICC